MEKHYSSYLSENVQNKNSIISCKNSLSEKNAILSLKQEHKSIIYGNVKFNLVK